MLSLKVVMGQISGSGGQKKLLAEHPVHNANDANISTYFIANITLRRGGIRYLAFKHHGKKLKTHKAKQRV